MFGRRFTLATGIVASALTLVAVTGPGTAFAARQPGWQRSLGARSKALDHVYRLDGTTARRSTVGADEPTWLKSLLVQVDREALELGLRDRLAAPVRSIASADPAWLKALIVRSAALDREYRLGRYASGS